MFFFIAKTAYPHGDEHGFVVSPGPAVSLN